MKRRVLSALLILLLVLASGCAYAAVGKQQQEAEGYALYFLEADLEASAGEGALRTETIYLNDMENASTAELAEALMAELLKGPLNETHDPLRDDAAVAQGGGDPGVRGPLPGIQHTVGRGADAGGLRHHPDPDAASGDSLCEDHRPWTGTGLS